MQFKIYLGNGGCCDWPNWVRHNAQRTIASGVYCSVVAGSHFPCMREVILVKGELSITLNIDLEALQWTCSMLGGSLICES